MTNNTEAGAASKVEEVVEVVVEEGTKVQGLDQGHHQQVQHNTRCYTLPPTHKENPQQCMQQ